MIEIWLMFGAIPGLYWGWTTAGHSEGCLAPVAGPVVAATGPLAWPLSYFLYGGIESKNDSPDLD